LRKRSKRKEEKRQTESICFSRPSRTPIVICKAECLTGRDKDGEEEDEEDEEEDDDEGRVSEEMRSKQALSSLTRRERRRKKRG